MAYERDLGLRILLAFVGRSPTSQTANSKLRIGVYASKRGAGAEGLPEPPKTEETRSHATERAAKNGDASEHHGVIAWRAQFLFEVFWLRLGFYSEVDVLEGYMKQLSFAFVCRRRCSERTAGTLRTDVLISQA